MTSRRPSASSRPARRVVRGAARPLLLVVLGVAVATLGGGLYYLATNDDGRAPGYGTDDEADDEGEIDGNDLVPTGAGDPGRASRRGPRAGDDTEETDDGGGIVEWDRDPEGDSFEITPETIRGLLAARHFEELRRQVDEFQRAGKVLPDDVVKALIDLLKSDPLRIDAMLTLGQVTDDATGRLLAELAADTNADEATRIAALEALSKSGQAAGLTHVRQLVETATEDTKFSRMALFALAAMGGQDGVAPLLSFLGKHADDGLTDAAVSALARAKGADAVLAQEMRAARDAADAARLRLLLRIGTQVGGKAGAEMRAEVKRIVESPDALSGLPEGSEARMEVFASAISVAAAMGGDALDAVVRVAQDQTGSTRSMALYALRQARGDAAAAQIATLAESMTAPGERAQVVVALGMTESRKATQYLHTALDDADRNVRHSAAAGLAQVRDPASVPVILERIEGAKGDDAMAKAYIDALGRIGVKDALPKLESIAASDDPFWKQTGPWVGRAINRIQTGDPDAKRIANSRGPAANPVRKPVR